MTIKSFRFNVQELGGALGDLGQRPARIHDLTESGVEP